MSDITSTIQAMDEADHRLGYHPVVDATQQAMYEQNRAMFKELFVHVWTSRGAASSREKALALTHLQEALMWLNADVACNYQPPAAPAA